MTLSKNISLGLASEIEKDYSMAVKAYNDAIRESPNDPTGYYYLGKLKCYNLNQRDGLQYLDTAYSLADEKFYILCDLISCHLNFENLQEARLLLSNNIGRYSFKKKYAVIIKDLCDRHDQILTLNLKRMLAKSRYSDIIDLLKSGGTLSFGQEASFIECVSYYHLMEFSHCEILLDKLISVNERFALARSLRGNLYLSIGRKRDAVVEFLNA